VEYKYAYQLSKIYKKFHIIFLKTFSHFYLKIFEEVKEEWQRRKRRNVKKILLANLRFLSFSFFSFFKNTF